MHDPKEECCPCNMPSPYWEVNAYGVLDTDATCRCAELKYDRMKWKYAAMEKRLMELEEQLNIDAPSRIRHADEGELEHLSSPACPPSHHLKCNNCDTDLEPDDAIPIRMIGMCAARMTPATKFYWCPKCLQLYRIPTILVDHHLKNSSETPRQQHTDS